MSAEDQPLLMSRIETPQLARTDVAASRATGAGGIAPDALAHLVECPDSILSTSSIIAAIAGFQRSPSARYLAVVDAGGAPIGAVLEIAIRDLLYSPFGHALLANPGCRWTLAEMVRPCASADFDLPIEDVLARYAAAENGEGMILTRGGRYAGLLPAQALLKLSAVREGQTQSPRLAPRVPARPARASRSWRAK